MVKKGKGKAGKKGKKAAPVREPDEFDEMDEETLRLELKKQTQAIDELRRSRNYYQLERDQIHQFYDIVRNETVEGEANIRNIESQMERLQDTHRNDIRIYMQKVIHLEYEHSKNLDVIDEQAQHDKHSEEDNHAKKRSDLNHLKDSLKKKLHDEELAYEEEIKQLKEVEMKETQKLREEFENNHKALQERYEERLKSLEEELELRRKMELHEIEERKNRHINDLMKNHERAFSEMRNYYNSITKDNLDLIKALKQDLEDLRSKGVQNEKTIEEVAHKNEMLAEPLAQAESRVASLQETLRNYEKDKASLKHAQARLLVLEGKLKSLTQDQNSLKEEYAKVEAERDELYTTFEGTVASVQHKNNVYNEAMEQKLYEYKDAFETRKTQFNSLLRSADLDPVAVHQITSNLDNALSSKNERIQDLSYEAAKIRKAHDDLLNVYKVKLQELGVPDDEIDVKGGFGNTMSGPADLLV